MPTVFSVKKKKVAPRRGRVTEVETRRASDMKEEEE